MPQVQSRRVSLLSKLILSALFLAALTATSFWLIHQFLTPPDKTVILLPKDITPPKPKPAHANPPQQANAALSGPAIGGVVVNESQKPVPYARINLSFWIDAAPNQRNYRGAQVRTDSTGRWTSTDVPRAALPHLRFSITQRDYAALSVQNTPANQLLTQSAQFILTHGFDLPGIVVNDAGLPLVGAKVTVGRNGNTNGTPSATSATNGKFTLHHLPPGPAIAVVATLPDFAPAAQSITPAASLAPIKFVLTAGRTLTGKVTDAHGQGVPDARVGLNTWLNTFRLTDISTNTDANGAYRLPHLPSDAIQMEVSKDGYTGDIEQLPADRASLDFQMSPQITLHGSVTDAQTHKAIPQFTLLTGVKWRGATNGPQFQRANLSSFSNGRYRQTLGGYTGPIDGWYVDIEAPGYLPFVSPPITQSGRQDFQLTPGADLTGRVFTADGKPARGVTVAVAGAGEQIEISSGEFVRQNAITVLADASGKFDLPPQTGRFAVVALGPGGIAQTDQDGLAKSTDLHLTPWARVQGTLMIGTKPGANQQVDLAWRQDGRFDPTQPRIVQNLNTQTDAQGHFSFDSVRPGPIRISRTLLVDFGNNRTMRNDTLNQSFTVSPGDTLAVNLGGDGRPVQGKVVLPPELANANDYFYLCRVYGPGRSYSARIEKDGSFRVDDVHEGAYELIISALPTAGGGALAQANHRFTIPPIPGGVSDDPLVLPDLQMSMMKR